jgi:hypothetical protein
MAKGQTLIFEQVLIFAISIAIFAAAFMLFSNYQSHYLSVTSEDHMKNMKNFVVNNIIKLSEGGDINSTIVSKIPTKVGDNYYEIILTNDNVTVMLDDGRFDYFNLGTLNATFRFSGKVRSTGGTVVIYKTGNSIIIR